MIGQVENQVALGGAEQFVIVGTAGSIRADVKPGEVDVVSSAARDDGISRHYLPPDTHVDADTPNAGSRTRPPPSTRTCRRTAPGGSTVNDSTRKESDDDGHSERDEGTDSCLSNRRVTKPPQHPGRGRRTDKRSTGDVIFEDWRARPIAPATERVTAAKSDECQHVSHPDDTNSHAHRNSQRHERALRSGRARCRFSFTHDEHCVTRDAPRTPPPAVLTSLRVRDVRRADPNHRLG
jgi:hypothetical protein